MTTTQTTQTFEERLAEAHKIADAHGPYEYGDTSNPVSRVRYEEEQAQLAEVIANCQYCKGVRTRASKNENDRRDACSEHASRRHLNYVCSPVSETYWCS